MTYVQTVALVLGWVGWLVALAVQLQARNYKQSSDYWFRRYLEEKRKTKKVSNGTKVQRRVRG